MNIAEVYLFLNDFKINQNFRLPREDLKKIVKLINLQSKTALKNSIDLDMNGFIELVLQLA